MPSEIEAEAESSLAAQTYKNYVKQDEIIENKCSNISSGCSTWKVVHKCFEDFAGIEPKTNKILPQAMSADASTNLLERVRVFTYARDHVQTSHSRSGSETTLLSTLEPSSSSTTSETGSFTREQLAFGALYSENFSSVTNSSSTFAEDATKDSIQSLNKGIHGVQGSLIINQQEVAEKDYIEFKILKGKLVENDSTDRRAASQTNAKSCSSHVLGTEYRATNSETRKFGKSYTLDSPVLTTSISEDSSSEHCLITDYSPVSITESLNMLSERAYSEGSVGLKFLSPVNPLKIHTSSQVKATEDCFIPSSFTRQISGGCRTVLQAPPAEGFGGVPPPFWFRNIDSKVHDRSHSSVALDFESPGCEPSSTWRCNVPFSLNSSLEKVHLPRGHLKDKALVNAESSKSRCIISQDRTNSSQILRKLLAFERAVPFSASPFEKSSQTSAYGDKSSSRWTSGFSAKDKPLPFATPASIRKVAASESRSSGRSLSECLLSPIKPKGNDPPEVSHSESAYADFEDNIPAFKSNRCMPTPKLYFGSGKPRLFKLKHSQHLSNRPPVGECASDPSRFLQARVRCVIQHGATSYFLDYEGLDEVLIAQTLGNESNEQDLVYAFFSSKRRGKGAVGWRSWRKKARSASAFLGLMKLTSKIASENELSNTGKSGFINLECVFLGNDEKERLSSFSKDSPRPSISSQGSLLSASPHFLSPSPSSFSPWTDCPNFLSPQPTHLGLPSPRIDDSPFSSHYISLSMLPSNLTSPSTTFRSSKLDRYSQGRSSHCSPMSIKGDEDQFWFNQDTWNDPTIAQSTAGGGCFSTSHLERVAVVIRMPLETEPTRSLGETLSLEQRWGWLGRHAKGNVMAESGLRAGSSFRFESSIADVSCEDQEHDRSLVSENPVEERDGCNFSSNCSKEGSTAGSSILNSENKEVLSSGLGSYDRAGRVNVTIILPNGDHGRPSHGVAGPQSLINRWRSGGNCDCGSWDLGCGLTILDSKLPGSFGSDASLQVEDKPGAQMNLDCNTLKMFMQAKKQEGAIMRLTPLQDGHFLLNFRSPLSALQAFASSVAVLYSMGPVTPVGKQEMGEIVRKPSTISLQSLSSALPSSQEGVASPTWRTFYGEYSNPDPPLSPIERL